MSPSSDRPDQLEQLVDRVLRGQPLRRAPHSLEERVLAEIERRAALPWWHRGFASWPRAARGAFLLVSLGFVTAGLKLATWLAAPLGSAAESLRLPAEVTAIQTVLTALMTVMHSVPALWVYGGMAVLAALYATLFGIGASAYRTVCAAR